MVSQVIRMVQEAAWKVNRTPLDAGAPSALPAHHSHLTSSSNGGLEGKKSYKSSNQSKKPIELSVTADMRMRPSGCRLLL